MDDIKNILAHNDGKLPEDMLLAYLEGALPAEQQHEVEQWLGEEGMESDAIEGLKTISPHDAKHAVSRLNHRLRKQLAGRKSRRKYIKETPLSWLAIVIILLLVALGYIIVRMAVKR